MPRACASRSAACARGAPRIPVSAHPRSLFACSVERGLRKQKGEDARGRERRSKAVERKRASERAGARVGE
eukprot:510313-Pleurochrysis_carterae.AAC.1